MTLTQVRRLQAGMFTFYRSAIWRVSSPTLVRRRTGFVVRIEAASGTPGPVLEVRPAELRPFGKARRASAVNQMLAEHLRALVHRV